MFDIKTMYYSLRLKFEVLCVICVLYSVSFVNYYVIIKTALSNIFYGMNFDETVKTWKN
jgi:hypothetical protein